ARLFSEKGFRETSMADLSRLTGAAEGTIFYHFKTKEDLFVSILDRLKKGILEEYEQYSAQREYGSGLEMMEGAISFYLTLAGALEDGFLLLHRYDLYQLSEVNPVCRGYLEDIYNCFIDIFEHAVVRGQEDQSIRKLAPRKTALIIFSMVDGLVKFHTFKLYDAGALYNEMLEACHRILENNPEAEVGEAHAY
ncbi:MAG: TetR/AcrR family transcriptional regulator, partial [Deltaproteobacteria bacterium]|nr:TetR/AcrR family transcriptional regulator [Deltaproteobacteria bacterium]